MRRRPGRLDPEERGIESSSYNKVIHVCFIVRRRPGRLDPEERDIEVRDIWGSLWNVRDMRGKRVIYCGIGS